MWTPPAPVFALPAAFPDSLAVLVFEAEGGSRLVAAIELVSPGNKDQDAPRRAFTAKCAGYLAQGIALQVIDVVTTRQANLHNDLMTVMGHDPRTYLSPEHALYAVAYQPIVRNGAGQIDVWPHAVELGQPLPVLPLALNVEVTLPIDLETTYEKACRRSRL